MSYIARRHGRSHFYFYYVQTLGRSNKLTDFKKRELNRVKYKKLKVWSIKYTTKRGNVYKHLYLVRRLGREVPPEYVKTENKNSSNRIFFKNVKGVFSK